MFGLLRDLALAIRAKGLRALLGEIPLVGSLADIVADALKQRRDRKEKAALRDEVEEPAANERGQRAANDRGVLSSAPFLFAFGSARWVGLP